MRLKFPVAALVPCVLFCASYLAAAQQVSEANRASAKASLDRGVDAYKKGQFDAAIAAFTQAKQLDPTLMTARLYLATTYASQYIPGSPAEENLAMGRNAVLEYQGVLQAEPNNLTAIDGISSVLYNMASNPFDPEKINESKAYHQRHVELRPDDPEPHYWIGVIDWAICYRANQNLREQWSKANPNGNLAPAEALPEGVRQDFADQCETTISEGIVQGKRAIALRPDYDDAMAYLNLLYRLRADMETQQDAREEDLKMAAELVDQVKTIREKRSSVPNPN
jgi:tetratricopeptide (TPR) repeat protein